MGVRDTVFLNGKLRFRFLVANGFGRAVQGLAGKKETNFQSDQAVGIKAIF